MPKEPAQIPEEEMTKAGKIPVYCRHDAIEKTGKLKPNPGNPNTHPEEQIERLAVIIETSGWRMPITVSLRSGMITKGHGRLESAKLRKWPEVPVEYQQYRSEAEEWADVISDNQLPELAETSDEAMAAALKSIRKSEFPLVATGYNEADFTALLKQLKAGTPGGVGRKNDAPPAPPAGRKNIVLHFTPEEHEEFEKLSAESMKKLKLLTTSETILRLSENAAKAK